MPSSKSAVTLTPALRKRIALESRAVNLPPTRYLDLLTRLGGAIRGAAFPQGIDDPELLERIVDNPLLLQLATTLAASLWQTLKSSQAEEATDTKASATAPPPSATTPQPVPTARPKRSSGSPFVGTARQPAPPV
ncbi:MAG: hypothetical protein OWS74_02575 [Firmicutes bacterium]|jgi:hypothetical protein|nr:hypothetical protein [Bacillota bacterium]